jgi:hypothetical protein
LPFESFIGPGIPDILAQKDLRRAASLGDFFACFADTGGFNVPPVSALYDARPLAFKPPLGFLPSLRCHAGVLGIIFSSSLQLSYCQSGLGMGDQRLSLML